MKYLILAVAAIILLVFALPFLFKVAIVILALIAGCLFWSSHKARVKIWRDAGQ